MEEKVVHMVLKVDLQCHRCYKKVRKILCQFPQIRDQVYNEEQGTVMIRVVCCTPEKIMNKISCKGYKSIKSIHIKEPEKNNEEDKKKEDPKVVAQPDQGNSPPRSVRNNPMYEGRPSYQYHDYGIPVAPSSYIGQPIYDSYGGGMANWTADLRQLRRGHGELDSLWRQLVEQSSDNHNQRN